MERACRDHVTFIALSGDSVPHFTTLAAFVSEREQDIVQVFKAVLLICLRQGLIGQEMFAIDGVKLPSNASKGKSGKRADFEKQLVKLEAAAAVMLQRHREQDDKAAEPLHDKSRKQQKASLFEPNDFTFDPESRTCICPAGKQLKRSGTHQDKKGFVGDRFRGSDKDCGNFPYASSA